MALVTVEDVLSYLGHDAEQDAFWVYCSDATATTATVQVAANVLTLNYTDSLGVAANNTFNLAVAPNDKIGTLVTAINALLAPVGVWHAGIFCHSLSVSIDLLETGVLNALLITNEQTLIITGDYLIGQLIARATDFLNRICRRTLEETEYIHERYDGGEQKIFLRNWPVTEVTQISSGKANAVRVRYTSATAYNAYMIVSTTGVTLVVDGTAAGPEITFAAPATLLTVANAINALAGWEATVAAPAYNSYPAIQIFRKLNRYALNQFVYLEIPDEPIDGYEVEYENGILYFPSTFSSGWRNIFVTYMAGYVAGAIPPALQQICIELVKYKYNLIKKDSALKSEQIGRVYAYTLGDMENALKGTGLLDEINLFMARIVQ